ncbi:AAA domain-containing protein, partial [bacterium]|nr:AAA domain-containing protein [bacterium]
TKVLNRDFAFSGVVGPSASMQPVYESILRASTSSLPVLIEGETGCGKEYIAESIHLNSKRQDKPFIILDCTATPSSLIEATLFGSTKGAFTGAIERKGLLEAANAGTLFLDEIGEIDPDIQPKLLRCLETKTFRPVGSTKESKSDFRIICATNRDLLSETKTGNFRQDLYYRLSALRISIPPLREHSSDIPVLARHFLQEIAQEQEEPVDFTPDALQALSRFAWPGNIRQLKFVVENAFFSRQGEAIDVGNLALDEDRGPELENEQEGMGIREEDLEKDFKSFRDEAVMSVEKQYIEQMLERAEGDVREAAKLAGLTREALYRVMSRCGISPANYRKK